MADGARKRNFIAGAIKRPGREKRRAAAHGVSEHQQMVTDSHSKNASLRGAGQLGLRLSAMAKKRTIAHGR